MCDQCRTNQVENQRELTNGYENREEYVQCGFDCEFTEANNNLQINTVWWTSKDSARPTSSSAQ